MTRISRLVHAVSWKHALGEVVLIFVGITLALALNSWANDRDRRSEQVFLLHQIRDSLTTDEADFEEVIGYALSGDQLIREVERLLDERLPYSDEVFEALGFILLTNNAPKITTGAYESLKSRGLDLISNVELRTRLVELHEDVRAEVDTQNALLRDLTMEMWGTFGRERFVMRSEGKSDFRPRAEPLNYESLYDDHAFYGYLTQRRVLVDKFVERQWRIARDEIQAVKALIDDELANLE